MDSFNNNDTFKQLVKGKLANYEHKVPSSGWEELEQSLLAQQNVKVMHKKWIISSIVAVAATLIGVFFLLQNTEELPVYTAHKEIELQQNTKTHKAAPKQAEEKEFEKSNKNKIDKSATPLFTNNVSSSKRKTKTPTTTIAIKSSTKNEKDETISNNTSIPVNDEDISTHESLKEQEKEDQPKIDEHKKQQMLQDFMNMGKNSLETPKDDTNKTKKRSKYTLSLSGQGGFSPSQNNTTQLATLRASIEDSYNDYTMNKIMAYNTNKEISPESETVHNQPVSFSFLASFNIIPKLQVETGLVYTYLSSETTNKALGFENKEKIQFHYLGVPINLNYTLLSINKADLFITAGAMIEKDINGKIKYYTEKEIISTVNSSYANEASAKINQQRPQFSISGGVGLSYPVHNKINLFGKMGGRYYFNANNEYKTYYSDKKFGLDIQLGIKFNF